MSAGMLVFYTIAVALIVGGTYAVHRILRRYGPLLALGLSALAAGALTLLWPIPIHGGFTTLAEAVYSEWSSNRARSAAARSDRVKAAYVAGLEQRFAGELPLVPGAAAADGWQHVTYASGQTAWLDTVNRQVWSAWLLLPATPDLPTLREAQARCRQLDPAGYWSLPTEAEHVLMWKAGGMDVLPTSRAGTVSFSIDADQQVETPAYRLAPSAQFAVRCVARGPDGPARGYIQADITLADWNRYQLSK